MGAIFYRIVIFKSRKRNDDQYILQNIDSQVLMNNGLRFIFLFIAINMFLNINIFTSMCKVFDNEMRHFMPQ